MDLIDREQAIYMLRINRPSMPSNNKETKSALRQFYRDLNAIQQTPSASKTARWIWIDDRYFCSECNNHAYGNRTEIEIEKWRYCPICGARMEQDE